MDTNSISNPRIKDTSREMHRKMFSHSSGDGFLDSLNDIVDSVKKSTGVFTMPLVSGFINKI